MRRFAILVVLLATACGSAWSAATAAAEFGPIQLISKSSKEQAGFAREPALSEDGDYVAFYGELGGRVGIFRKDLLTGALTLVVEGVGEGGAEAPSISAEGRYVSFTTTRSLEPAADPQAMTKDVYVADLASGEPTYELASASNGERMPGNSVAAPRVALSANGREVAFVNEGQVYVRDLETSKPTLISARRDRLDGAMTEEPVSDGGAYQPSGAALSADGNAVAWVGEHLPEQVPLLRDEEERIQGIESESGENSYREPLWRLVPTESDENPPTRRIIGGGDPLAPGCPEGGTLTEPVCQGPFPALTANHDWTINAENGYGKGWGTALPKMSADGSTVATIGWPEEVKELFVVDMASGLTRDQASKQLTRWINPDPGARSPEIVFRESKYLQYTGQILECAISPNGDEIAFATERQYLEGGPTLISPRPASPSMVPELYQVNLGSQTIERVTPGPGTGISLAPSEGIFNGATAPSYDADGSLLAFADSAYNLVAGDANESSDVFTVESKPAAKVEPSLISPPPSSISVLPTWRLSGHAVSRPNGAVRVVATVPGAGALGVSARSPLGPRLRSRVVDSAQRRTSYAGVIRIELDLPRGLRSLSHRKGGLYTALSLQFSGPGGKPLKEKISARFRAHRKKTSTKGKGR
jgi:Tol biopolymer transport system component